MKDNTRKNNAPKNCRHKVKRILARVRNQYNIKEAFTESDFYRICEAENIFLCNAERLRVIAKQTPEVKGLRFATIKGDAFIYLKSFFEGDFDIFSAMHELGHHFCGHKGLTNLMTYSTDSPKELEADYFAELALQAEVKNACKN